MSDEVLVVGIGGPTSSGKSTIVQNLVAILQPSSESSPIHSVHVLHQDDFCPPQNQMPYNTEYNVTDWDTPHGSTDYRRLERVIRYFYQHKSLPEDFESHEYRRSNYQCTLPTAMVQEWRKKLHDKSSQPRIAPPKIHVLIVEGFLTFFDTAVCKLYGVRIFLRISKQLVMKRRYERPNYVLDDGSVWEDPPFYFDAIVWPAYLEAHAKMFQNQDVECGQPIPAETRNFDGGPVPHLNLIEAQTQPIESVVNQALQCIYEAIRKYA
ncbi:hypothetical protein MYAM1_003723 [Malassezia yamatoensis]|uniref:Phosphoribulokinase/uridine kinase domain-containing protein n=1 Tax=Malassezia yamatoensis TaxID=253288 RepID=A0AAJ5YVD7_9BASI|nr:hypothetical protein MYAM1_003723 [Malassezia yamatoensis]